MQYIPGISLGNITFGMTVQEVVSVMGPDGVLEPADSGDMQLSFEKDGISFLFYQEDDLLLSSILVERKNIPVEFKGYDLFALSYMDVINLLESEGDESEHSFEVFDDLGEVEEIEYETLGMILYFDVTKMLLEVTLFELTEDTGSEDEDDEDDEEE